MTILHDLKRSLILTVLLLVAASLAAQAREAAVAPSVPSGAPTMMSSPRPDAAAVGPVARGVFFFSPTCPECTSVISERLPAVFERFGGPSTVTIDEAIDPADVAFYLLSNDQLQLLMVDVSVDPGARMFVADSERLGLDRASELPRLDIGDGHIVGPVEIPERLPDIVEAGLSGDGIPWPPVPGLAAALAPFPQAGQAPDGARPLEGAAVVLPGVSLSTWDRFVSDPLGNGLAVVVLLLQLASLVAVPLRLARGTFPAVPSWPVPLLAILGMAISAYIGSAQASGMDVVCGPAGDCNAVQGSAQAWILGIHVGVLGVIGFALLLAGWLVGRLVHGRMEDVALVLVGVGTFAGTLVSAYLTFLQPFVIGATCLWCLISALAMLGLLWSTAAPAWRALRRLRGPAAAPTPGAAT